MGIQAPALKSETDLTNRNTPPGTSQSTNVIYCPGQEGEQERQQQISSIFTQNRK